MSKIKKKRTIEQIAEFEAKIEQMEKDEAILADKLKEIPKIKALFVIKNT